MPWRRSACRRAAICSAAFVRACVRAGLGRPSEPPNRFASGSIGRITRSTAARAIGPASADIAASNSSMRRSRQAADNRAKAGREASGTSGSIASNSVNSCTQQRANASKASTSRTWPDVGERGAPARGIRLFNGTLARRTGLVEQHEHGLADPLEHLELGGEVAGVGGRLGRVHEVEHHVGLLGDVAHRELAEPQHAVLVAVPHLRQEPPDGVTVLPQPARESHAVAEARGVPQREQVAVGASARAGTASPRR